MLLSICFSSGYPVLFLKHTWIFRIHSSPGENTENQGTLLLNDFSLSDQLTESWGLLDDYYVCEEAVEILEYVLVLV